MIDDIIYSPIEHIKPTKSTDIEDPDLVWNKNYVYNNSPKTTGIYYGMSLNPRMPFYHLVEKKIVCVCIDPNTGLSIGLFVYESRNNIYIPIDEYYWF